MSYCEKVKKANELLKHPNARNVVRERHPIPYFERQKVRWAMKMIYFFLRHHMDKIVFIILSKV